MRMDRRRDVWVRTGTLVGCALVAAAALWSAGFPPTGFRAWWDQLWEQKITEEKVVQPPIAAPAFNPSSPEVAIRGIDSSLSPTPIPLVLVSVVPGRNAREGTAVLGPDASNPQTYAAGALLENGARLVEIYPDRVVLERKGKRVALFLNGKEKADVVATRVAELATVGGRKVVLLSKPSSVDAVSESVRAQAAYDKGKFVGFQVYPGRSGGSFQQLGLQAGDIIQFIDGKRISSDSQWGEISGALADGALINVSITREDQLMHLTLDGLALINNGSSNKP